MSRELRVCFYIQGLGFRVGPMPGAINPRSKLQQPHHQTFLMPPTLPPQISYLWLAGNEGMDKTMETTIKDYIGTTIRIHPFFHSELTKGKTQTPGGI